MRFTVGKKIGLGFSIVLTLLLIVFVFTLYVVTEAETTLKKSITSNEKFIKVDQPTEYELNHLKDQLAKTQKCIQQWVYQQSDKDNLFKLAACELIDSFIPSDTVRINALVPMWGNTNNDREIYAIIKKKIVELLNNYNEKVRYQLEDFSSYEEDWIVLFSQTSFETEIEPLFEEITTDLDTLISHKNKIAQSQQKESNTSFKHTNSNFKLLFRGILLAGIILLAGTLIIAIFTALSITRPVQQLKGILIGLGRGVFPSDKITASNDEIGEMSIAMNSLVTGLQKTTRFAHEVGQSNFDYPYQPLSEEDVLGHALLKMKDELAETERILEQKVKERTEEVVRQKDEIDIQKSKLEELYNDVTDSIRYAKRLQDSILPPERVVNTLFPSSFVLFIPKDIVSGDFYWMNKIGEKHLFAAVDCTGHGVPGAFMSLVGANGLNSAVKEHKLNDPGKILDDLNIYAHEALYKEGEGSSVKDGMDISLCALDHKKMEVEFAGAYNPLYIIRDGEILITKGDKFAIGGFIPDSKNYSTIKIPVQSKDTLYVFSDGYADQFGGSKGKKFMYRQFRETLLSINEMSMDEQKEALHKKINDWKGSYEQVDDILIIGVRV